MRPVDDGRVSVLGLPVTRRASQASVVSDCRERLRDGRPFLCTFVNPLACRIADREPVYLESLRAFDRVLCDGVGLVVAARLLGHLEVSRFSFDATSLAPPVFELCRETDSPVFLVGGSEGVAPEAADVLSDRFPGLRFAGTSSGFFERPEPVIRRILDSEARVTICGMGAPRQERFLLRLREGGWNGVGFTCGGFFDQIIKRFDYYPAWIDALNLRFAYRLFDEPRRLWKRYTVDYLAFWKSLAREITGLERTE